MAGQPRRCPPPPRRPAHRPPPALRRRHQAVQGGPPAPAGPYVRRAERPGGRRAVPPQGGREGLPQGRASAGKGRSTATVIGWPPGSPWVKAGWSRAATGCSAGCPQDLADQVLRAVLVIWLSRAVFARVPTVQTQRLLIGPGSLVHNGRRGVLAAYPPAMRRLGELLPASPWRGKSPCWPHGRQRIRCDSRSGTGVRPRHAGDDHALTHPRQGILQV